MTAAPSARAATRLLDDALMWRATDRHGQSRRLTIRYRLHGRLGAPLRIVLGGVSATRQVQCWWREHYGAGQALNPEHSQILSVDWLDHATGISTHDQADAIAQVLDHLGIDAAEAFVGASYGAMVGLAFAQRHGHRLKHLIAISGAHCSRPAAQALRQIQRAVLDLGEAQGDPAQGVRWARALALTTYRPAALFDERFKHADPNQTRAELANYLKHQGRRYSNDVSAARYRCLSESLDSHYVLPALIRCRVDLVGVDTDELVPLDQLRELDALLQGTSQLHVLHSTYGHDAFLKEDQALRFLLRRLLTRGEGHE
ncbi:MAG: homoserine O-succinyltransferase [Pseudomonadota bacterium]